MENSNSILKRSVRQIAQWLLSHDALWEICSQIGCYASVQRNVVEESRFRNKCDRCFADSVVKSGPFAGLRYPSITSYGSAIYPKLIGTYESELFCDINNLMKDTYDSIIDIGFAEGYYLIGFGRLLPHAQLWGFDISTEAHRLCTDLADANGIGLERLNLAYDATPNTIRSAMNGRTLVISDCEGFERKLFTHDSISLWSNADLIIECHDFIVPDTKNALSDILSGTHNISIVNSEEFSSKINRVSGELQRVFSKDELARLICEGRPCAMNWIIAISKQHFITKR